MEIVCPHCNVKLLLAVTSVQAESTQPVDEAEEYMHRWNRFAALHGLQPIRHLTPKRIKSINARTREGMPERLDDIEALISTSDFLLGRCENAYATWKGCTFDFLWMSRENWHKILEYKYNHEMRANKKRPGDHDHLDLVAVVCRECMSKRQVARAIAEKTAMSCECGGRMYTEDALNDNTRTA